MSRRLGWAARLFGIVAFGAPTALAQAPPPDLGPSPSETPALAEPQAPSRWERPLAVVAHGNVMGGPYGMLGLSVELAPSRYFSVGAGAGTGVGHPQFAALVHGHFFHGEAWALVVGAGPSFGRYQPFRGPDLVGCDRQRSDPPCNSVSEYASARWLNVEVGVDRKSTRLNSSHVVTSRMPSSA